MTAATPPLHVDLAVLGTVVRVRLDNPEERQALDGPWHLCMLGQEQRDVPDSRVVTLPASSSATSRQWALTTLTQDVTRAAISEQTGRLLMLHAGALSNLETGATVAYVAPGGTGKTTITTTLGQGRGYVTDETVGLTRAGDVVPYPKPLSVRREGGGKDEVAPRELGLQPTLAQPWLARLLVVRRDPTHVGEPDVQELSLLDAIVALGPETSALAALPEPLATCRDVIVQAGGVLQVTYREATQLEDIVLDGLERSRS